MTQSSSRLGCSPPTCTSRASSCSSPTARRSRARRASKRRSRPRTMRGVTVYPIGIESPSFKPAPLKRLASETGGRYSGAAGTASLQAIYAALAQELRRTWQLTYFTTARPGDTFELAAGAARAEGAGARSRSGGHRGVDSAGPVVRSRPDARRHAGRLLHPRRRSLPLQGAGRSRSAPAARAAHR